MGSVIFLDGDDSTTSFKPRDIDREGGVHSNNNDDDVNNGDDDHND
jgi:hypothetical protein